MEYSLKALKAHSASCPKHPAVIKYNKLRNGLEQLCEKLSPWVKFSRQSGIVGAGISRITDLIADEQKRKNMTDERKYEITAGLLKKIRGWESKYGYSASMPDVAKRHTLDQYIVYDINASIQDSIMIQVKGKIADFRAWEDVSFMQNLVQDMLELPGIKWHLIFRAQFDVGKWLVELFNYLPKDVLGKPAKIHRHVYRVSDSSLAYATWIMLASYYELLTIEETADAEILRVESEMFSGNLQVANLADEMKAKQSEKTKEESKKADSPDPSKLFNQILTEMYNIRLELQKCAKYLETPNAT